MTEDQHHPTSGHTATPGHPTTSDERDPPRPQTDQPPERMKGEWIGLRSEESSSLDRDRWILGIIEASAKVIVGAVMFVRTHALVLDPDGGRLSRSVHPDSQIDVERL